MLLSSWDAQTVWRLDAQFTPRVLFRGVVSPTGLAVDTRRDRLAVTSMQGNALYLMGLP